MVGHVDTLEQQESFFRPLVVSAVMHAGLFSFIAVSTYLGLQGRVLWGTPQAIGGGAVGIQAVKQLPMPVRTGAANPLANDTESRVPQPPKPEPKKAKPPEPDAIPIKGREILRKPTYTRSQQYSQYHPAQERPNQLYSDKGQALSSTMFGGGVQGSGGVGMNPGSAFGNRFGWYRDLLSERVAQKWHTEDVDPRIQTLPVAIVTFEIARNGSISNVRLLQGSGNAAMDRSAERAIYEAGPFPPLPQGYERSSANIEFWFQLKR
jgi:periplasmic protein TonB